MEFPVDDSCNATYNWVFSVLINRCDSASKNHLILVFFLVASFFSLRCRLLCHSKHIESSFISFINTFLFLFYFDSTWKIDILLLRLLVVEAALVKLNRKIFWDAKVATSHRSSLLLNFFQPALTISIFSSLSHHARTTFRNFKWLVRQVDIKTKLIFVFFLGCVHYVSPVMF